MRVENVNEPLTLIVRSSPAVVLHDQRAADAARIDDDVVRSRGVAIVERLRARTAADEETPRTLPGACADLTGSRR